MCIAQPGRFGFVRSHGIVLTMKDDEQEEDDEMLAEYDLSKLKFMGRGIYAERFRAEVEFFVVNDRDCANENDNDEERRGER